MKPGWQNSGKQNKKFCPAADRIWSETRAWAGPGFGRRHAVLDTNWYIAKQVLVKCERVECKVITILPQNAGVGQKYQ